jgi:hypothetical protein
VQSAASGQRAGAAGGAKLAEAEALLARFDKAKIMEEVAEDNR